MAGRVTTDKDDPTTATDKTTDKDDPTTATDKDDSTTASKLDSKLKKRVKFDMSEQPRTRSAVQRAKAQEKKKQLELGSEALREAQKARDATLMEMSREERRVHSEMSRSKAAAPVKASSKAIASFPTPSSNTNNL